jgi:hypothetical protein
MQSQEPAAGRHIWKVYTNVRFNYKISYPADLPIPQARRLRTLLKILLRG